MRLGLIFFPISLEMFSCEKDGWKCKEEKINYYSNRNAFISIARQYAMNFIRAPP